LTGAGRPHLRTAAWRAVWGAVKNNPVYAARYRDLTTRETNKLKPTQAQTVLAGAILRQLHGVGFEPSAALRAPRGISSLITGRPGPSSPQPDHTLPSTSSVTAMQGLTTSRGPAQHLTQYASR
jgi:hypothetical protein